MKDEVHPPAAPTYADHFKAIVLLVFSCVFLCAIPAFGQCAFHHKPYQYGETLEYAVYFKWGILMPKAGEATFTYNKSDKDDTPENISRLLFRTTGMFETIYKMRDTLESYSDANSRVILGEKRANDGGYYSVDRLEFSYANDSTYVQSLRYNKKRTVIDTTLVAAGCALDMAGTILYLRSVNMEEIHVGEEHPFNVMIGRDVISASFRYAGEKIIDVGNKMKFRTHHFIIDVYDDAFVSTKSAVELWIGDDENRIPIKIRAKLKLGAAEARFRNAEGLKHPISCQVDTKEK